MAAEVEARLAQRPTGAELAVLQLAANGHTYQSIAHQLNVSVDTAKRRGHNALRKLGARTTTHAVAIAISRGLIPGAQGEN